MRSFSDIIDHLGIEATAEAIGVTRKHVTVMKARDSIPPVYWDKILLRVKQSGVNDLNFDVLREFRSGKEPASQELMP